MTRSRTCSVRPREELAGVGIEVLWPSALLDDDLTATAVPMQAAGQVTDAGLNLQALLSFRWRLTLGGEELDETEVAELAEAKRPLVRIRDRASPADKALRDRG